MYEQAAHNNNRIIINLFHVNTSLYEAAGQVSLTMTTDKMQFHYLDLKLTLTVLVMTIDAL